MATQHSTWPQWRGMWRWLQHWFRGIRILMSGTSSWRVLFTRLHCVCVCVFGCLKRMVVIGMLGERMVLLFCIVLSWAMLQVCSLQQSLFLLDNHFIWKLVAFWCTSQIRSQHKLNISVSHLLEDKVKDRVQPLFGFMLSMQHNIHIRSFSYLFNHHHNDFLLIKFLAYHPLPLTTFYTLNILMYGFSTKFTNNSLDTIFFQKRAL